MWSPSCVFPSRDRILREFLRLRQRGKIGLHRPAGVQQRLGIGTVGDSGEVALTVHPVGLKRPRAGRDPVQQRPVYPAGVAADLGVDPVGGVGIVALTPDDDRGVLALQGYRPVCQRRSWCRRQTTVTPRSPSGPPSGIPGGDDCGYSCILPLFCRLPA